MLSQTANMRQLLFMQNEMLKPKEKQRRFTRDRATEHIAHDLWLLFAWELIKSDHLSVIDFLKMHGYLKAHPEELGVFKELRKCLFS